MEVRWDCETCENGDRGLSCIYYLYHLCYTNNCLLQYAKVNKIVRVRKGIFFFPSI